MINMILEGEDAEKFLKDIEKASSEEKKKFLKKILEKDYPLLF